MTARSSAGKVAWRRYAMVVAPSLVLAGGAVALTGQGALAASFAVSGNSFKLAASQLEGKGFTNYGAVDTSADGTKRPVTPAGFKTAELTNLCQSVVTKTPFGDVVMRLEAGKDTPVKAENLVADFDQLAGNIVFTGYESGVSAAALDGPATGPEAAWGQQAATISITDLKQRTWATTAGSFALQGLSIDVSFDAKECF